MASLTSLRAGLAARLATISGLRTYAFVPDKPEPPCAVVGLPEVVDYDATMGRGIDRWVMPIRLYVAKATDLHAQTQLEGYLASTASTGLKTAIEADPTLGGAAETTRVLQAKSFGVFDIGDTSLLGCEFKVEVYA